MTQLNFSLLGPIDIEHRRIPLVGAPHDKAFALLAYLAVENDRPHNRETLADMLWPHLPSERGRHNLRQTLFRLRNILGENDADTFISTDRHRIWFNRQSHYRLDVEHFKPVRAGDSIDELLRRLTLYRGLFMEDLRCELGESFDLWLEEQRARTHRIMLSLLESAYTHYRSTRETAAAIHWAGRYVELAPWDEKGHQRLIRLLAADGQRGAAIAHYRAMADSLQRELGITPSEESAKLIRDIEQKPDDSGPIRANRSAWHPSPDSLGLNHEYRQITVLRCGFSCQYLDDPEEFAGRVAEPMAQAVRIIEQHNGWVAAARSTGILAYFGWPTADERAAMHAVRTAIGLSNQMGDDPIGRNSSTAIHTGPVILTGGTNPPDTIGLTTDIAVRLQASTRPGTITISEATRRCIRNRFEMSALPPLTLGEQSRPLSVWRVHRSIQGSVMDEIAHQPQLFGRDVELELLLEDWHQACTTRCVVSVIAGEAGLGKTRLLQALVEKADQPLLRETSCDPLMRHTPYYPLTQFLRRHLDLPRHCDSGFVAQRLEQHYSAIPGSQEVIKPLQWLLTHPSYDANVDSHVTHGSAERRQLADAVVSLLRTSAENTPVMLVIEDLHWVDPSTLALLEHLATHLIKSRIHMVLTMRNTAVVPTNLLNRAHIVQLKPLDLPSSLRLTQCITPPDTTTSEFALMIARKSEGIPMFIVELMHMLHDDTESEVLPGKLQELISARIEQADEDKPLLRAAAVIGREFNLEHLASLLCQSEEQIAPGLDRLHQRRLIDRIDLENHSYRFTHALVHQTVYQSITRSQRRTLHQRFAALLQKTGDTIGNADVIAWHLGETGDYVEAIQWWLRGGRDAATLAAYSEAISHFERGLQLIDQLPDREAHWQLELDLLINLVYPLAVTEGHYAPKTERIYRRALEISQVNPIAPHQNLALLRSHWFGASSRSSFIESRDIARRMIELAESVRANVFAALGYYLYGNASLWMGDFATARDYLEETLTRLNRTEQESEYFLHSDQQFDIAATGYLGWNMWFLGNVERALKFTARAVRMAETRQHPATLMTALATYIGTRIWCQRPAEVAAAAERLNTLCGEHGFRMWADISIFAKIWAGAAATGASDALEEAEETMQRIIAAWPGGASGFQYILLDACAHAGDTDRGWRILSDAWISIQATGAQAFYAACKLIEARLLELENQNYEHCLREAIEIAEQQGSPSLAALGWGMLAQLYGSRSTSLPETVINRLRNTLESCTGIDYAPALSRAGILVHGFV